MCFEFGSCFGSGRREDYGGERAPRAARAHGRSREDRRNGYYSGTDHKSPAPAPAYNLHHQPHAPAADEAGHKAYHDVGARKDHHADANAGGNGRYAAYVQDKAGSYDTPKHPAWHNKVGDDAGYTYAMRPREFEAAADRRENAAMDYHHYPTSTTNTSLVR